ncbi:MAG: serine/threonine-protein kinase PknK, partial [Cyanobacteria bacterium P01_C01_bin.73]
MSSPATNLSLPFQMTGYAVVEQLYQGDRTLVYRAVQNADQRPVVIKLLRNEHPNFNELVQFRNQYAIAKNLEIAGVVKPLALAPCGNGYALVMEDFGGLSLSQHTKAQKLSVEQVLAIALQLATILHDLHQAQVIHKDIKPANILIHPETEQIRLIDFSIASLLPKETQDIQTPSGLEGTLAYVAPEQTGRMNRGIDYRADFYTLGVTLFELLTGQLPFQSSDPMELVHSHIAQPPPLAHQLNAEVPLMLSRLVQKLMAKNAEDRYQSATGLKHDLELLQTQPPAQSKLAEFNLAERDISDRFLIPEKLYGRAVEINTLLAAFERVADGASELVLVAGFSGIGKTAVVNEVHKPITRQNGYFVKGKFDQFNRDIPLSAFVQALRSLVSQLLAESDARLAQWRANILAAVGESGQVLIEVMPELTQIIGEQPPVPNLPSTAAQNRFNLLFQKFIEVVSTPAHPLVLFLDDLQWADTASLQLIKLLLDNRHPLLLVGAYRDNEVSPAHPLMLTVGELKQAQVIVNAIALLPLRFEHINQLVADTLSCTIDLARPLANLVNRKTQGNPFFIAQFLKALHEDGHIIYNQEGGYWQCDIAQIKALALTDDVVKLMVRQVQKLPSETQSLLKLAACVGNQFDLETLATVSKQVPTKVAGALWQALQENLIVPTGQIYPLFQSDDLAQPQTQSSLNPTYRFLHDRIQQAAYSLIPDAQKQDTHYQIGQLLKARILDNGLESRIFELLSHLNIGVDQIVDCNQKKELAQLNLVAGRKAKASAAYAPALKYCRMAIGLLTSQSWETDYQFTLSLYELAAESAYACGRDDLLEQYAEAALSHTIDDLDRLSIYEIKIQAYTVQDHFSNALETGKQALQRWGIAFPEEISLAVIRQELKEIQSSLEVFTFKDLESLPQMRGAYPLASMRLLSSIIGPAYISEPLLFPLIVLRMLRLSLEHGNAASSPYAYACYGTMLVSVANSTEKLDQIGELALNLLENFSDRAAEVRTKLIVGSHISHWKFHISRSLSLVQESYQIAANCG